MRAMHLMTLLFAREAGVEPDLRLSPDLAGALLFGPLSAVSFRLSGPDKLLEAGIRVATEAQACGTLANPEFSSDQVAQLQALAADRKDPEFAKFVDRIAAPNP
jgi:dimethylaniline monooxygenase (N-oxide forming)